MAFHPQGNAIAVANGGSPYVVAYPWSDSGFGTKYSDPSSPLERVRQVDFSPDGDAIAISDYYTNNMISVYAWSGSGFGTRYTSPTKIAAFSTGYSVKFSRTAEHILLGIQDSPYILAYPWNVSTGFGTRLSNPASLPAGEVKGIYFTTANDAVAVAWDGSSPRVRVYAWSGSGFGTAFSNPATVPTGNGLSVVFSPNDDAIAVGHETSPFISAYPWSGSGFGTKYSNPGTLPSVGSHGISFSPGGGALAASSFNSPYVLVYNFDVSSGFGAKFADPATTPTNSVFFIAFGEI